MQINPIITIKGITMTKLLLAAALLVGFGTAQAGELDNEKTVTTEQISLAADLPATVVVRVKAGTNEVEVLHSNTELAADAATQALVSTSSFVKMDVKGQQNAPKNATELDKDSSSSSWYFCFPTYNYYQPSYYYYGYQYSYQSYYSYYYSGYQYNYYRWGWY